MDRSQGEDVQLRTIVYDPLPSQKRFHASAARFKGFSGPIGSGKSQALCQEAIRLSYINAGRQGLLGAPTYPMLRDATLSTLFQVLNENDVPYEYGKADNVLTMTDTQSRILLRSMDDFERLRGTNLAWFGLDELTYTPQPVWSRLEGRLRDPKATKLCGFAVWTPKGYDWVYQRFVAEPVQGYEVILAKPFENRHLLDHVPDFYERLRLSYDKQFFEQEVLGEYVNMYGGRVYGAFDRGRHVRPIQLDPAKPLLWALDFNVDPMCSVLAQIAGGEIRVADEIQIRYSTTRQACEEFLKRYKNHPAGLIIYGDASGNAQQTTGNTDYEIIREFFRVHTNMKVQYRVPRANPHVRERISLVNSKLWSASGEASLFVDSKCAELIKDLEQVSYKQDSTQIDKDRDRRRTHLSDALGYLVWQECRPLPQAGEQPRRLF